MTDSLSSAETIFESSMQNILLSQNNNFADTRFCLLAYEINKKDL